MLHKTRNLTCLIFANGVSHFSKRYKISPNWHGSISNDPSGTEETGSPSQERDALSACSPIGKAHPTLSANSGTCFPLAAQRENTSHSEPRFWDVLSATPPQRETASHSEGKFRDTFSARGLNRSPVSHSKAKFRDALSKTPSIRKARPTLGALELEIISLLGLPLIKGARLSRKKPRGFRGFHVCLMERSTPRAAGYSPSTAFLAAAAI